MGGIAESTRGYVFKYNVCMRTTLVPLLAIATGAIATLTMGALYLLPLTYTLDTAALPAAVIRSEVANRTNAERTAFGVPTLQRNALLDEAAQRKAEDMAAKGYYAHISPEGRTPMDWVEEAGYRYQIVGENIVVNRPDAEAVLRAFMGSPGHKANVLRTSFTEIGIGVATGTYKGKEATFTVQMFAAPITRE